MELAQLNDALKAHDLELIIGIETHVRLNTKTKFRTPIFVQFVLGKWEYCLP